MNGKRNFAFSIVLLLLLTLPARAGGTILHKVRSDPDQAIYTPPILIKGKRMEKDGYYFKEVQVGDTVQFLVNRDNFQFEPADPELINAYRFTEESITKLRAVCQGNDGYFKDIALTPIDGELYITAVAQKEGTATVEVAVADKRDRGTHATGKFVIKPVDSFPPESKPDPDPEPEPKPEPDPEPGPKPEPEPEPEPEARNQIVGLHPKLQWEQVVHLALGDIVHAEPGSILWIPLKAGMFSWSGNQPPDSEGPITLAQLESGRIDVRVDNNVVVEKVELVERNGEAGIAMLMAYPGDESADGAFSVELYITVNGAVSAQGKAKIVGRVESKTQQGGSGSSERGGSILQSGQIQGQSQNIVGKKEPVFSSLMQTLIPTGTATEIHNNINDNPNTGR